jgi:hypothetical protein
MSNATENPYSAPLTELSYNSRRLVPLREIVVACVLSFMTWGTVMWNHDLPIELHNIAIISLAFKVALLSLWGCILAVWLTHKQRGKKRFVALGMFTSLVSAFFAGIAMVHSGVAPHGLLLPTTIAIGMTTTYFASTRS